MANPSRHSLISTSSRRGKVGKRTLLGLALVLCLGGVVYATIDGQFQSFFSSSSVRSDLITAPVKRGDLRISVIATGNLDSASNVTLSSNVQGSTKIISIVPEGTIAYEGMVLVQLDASVYTDQLDEQKIKLEQANALRDQARDAVAIQKSVNEREIAAAELAYDLAQLDLDKYKQGDYKVLVTQAQTKITLAKEKVAQSLDAFAFAKRQSKKGYVTQNELEQKRVLVSTAELELQQAILELDVLENYQYERDIAEKEALATDTKLELSRVEQKASAALNQAEADLSACEATAVVEKTKYDKLVSQIEECTIRAPQAGQVIYAQQDSRRSQERVIEEGASVDNRQAIVKLPDLSQMKVDTKIHESKIGMVSEGMPAVIKVSRKSNSTYNGVVQSVASVPNSPSWRQPDLREYTAVIAVNTSGRDATSLKPGLTAEVEIISDILKSVLKIPVQAIIARNGKHFVFVNQAGGPAIRQVVLGATNDVESEVRVDADPETTSKFALGLEEGEQVVLAPRTSLPGLYSELEDAEPEKAVSKQPPGDFEGFPKPSPGGPGGKEKREQERKGSGGDGPGGKGPGSDSEGPSGPGGGQQLAGGVPSAAAIFQQLDKNSDGAITKDEATGPMSAGFDKSDANSDGKVDASEFEAAVKERLKQRAASGGGGSQ